MNPVNRRLEQLTFTRFLAALSVVFFHTGRGIGVFYYLPMLTAGPTAVRYFFVLSGFVMALAYYHPDSAFDFRSYWLARFSRIYPVYILSFVLTCLYYIDILARLRPPKFLASLFLYQAWIPKYALSFNIAAWSLSVEVFFYLLLPFLLLWAGRQPVKFVIWNVVIFYVASESLQFYLTLHSKPGMENFLAYFPPFHLSAFLTGLAGGIWYLTFSGSTFLNQIANRSLLATSLGIVLLLLTLRQFVPSLPLILRVDSLFIPLFLIIILTLARDNSRLSRILKHPGLVLLGDASYALFILHVPLRWMFMWLIDQLGNKTTLDAIFWIYIFVTIEVSILTFLYIERPVRDWLRSKPRMLTTILLDAILIFMMIRVSFILRVGTDTSAYTHTLTFALRVGLAVFFLAMLFFRFYLIPSWHALFLAMISGGIVLSGSVYYAWISGWVESFPRSILILIPILCFSAIYISRILLNHPAVHPQPETNNTV